MNKKRDQWARDLVASWPHVPKQVASPTELAAQLREYASNPGYSHNDYADTMREAADMLAERAVSPAESVQNLWTLIDAYADAREEYQRSTARHLAKQQRENMDDAKSVLSSAIGAQFTAAREEGANTQDHKWAVFAKEMRETENELRQRVEAAHAEGRRSAMEELAKEKERADSAEAERDNLNDVAEKRRKEILRLDKLLAARQVPALSKLETYQRKAPGCDHTDYNEMAEYYLAADVQAHLSGTAQPLQQEGGKKETGCKRWCGDDECKDACVNRTPQQSDNLQQSSTAQADTSGLPG